jgi:hypothetical protein
MKSTSVLVCAALLAVGTFGCGSEERVVRRTTTIQQAAPAPTPVVERSIRTEERTYIAE